MLASITPLGERGRNRSWGLTAAFYTVGSVAGGATRGALLGAVGMLIPQSLRPSPTGVAVILAILLAAAAVIAGTDLPITTVGPQRQVNEDWLDTYRGWVVGVGFGFQLGFALAVYITTAGLYVVFAAELLTFSWRVGMLLGAIFGFARSLPVLAARTVTTPQRLRAAHERMSAAAGTAHTTIATACAVAALVLAAGVWR
jgi:hypothetical protein